MVSESILATMRGDSGILPPEALHACNNLGGLAEELGGVPLNMHIVAINADVIVSHGNGANGECHSGRPFVSLVGGGGWWVENTGFCPPVLSAPEF